MYFRILLIVNLQLLTFAFDSQILLLSINFVTQLILNGKIFQAI